MEVALKAALLHAEFFVHAIEPIKIDWTFPALFAIALQLELPWQDPFSTMIDLTFVAPAAISKQL